MSSTVDTTVDVWSLGWTLYACLVKHIIPFEARGTAMGDKPSMGILRTDLYTF